MLIDATREDVQSPCRSAVSQPTVARKSVLILQPQIQHYRVPVFDGLRELAANSYAIEVCGTMRDGEAIGGGRRAYFQDYPLKSVAFARQSVEWWPRILDYVHQSQPSAVVTTLYPSNLTTWRLPSVCCKLGIPCIGWTKVHSRSKWRIAPGLKRRLFHRYDFILAYGALSREELTGLGYPRERVFVAQNTIDTQRIFDRYDDFCAQAKRLRQTQRLDGQIVLLCIAKIEQSKRHHDLLRAWPRLRELDQRLHLVLIGSGSLAAELRTTVGELGTERVRFVGRVPAGADYTWIAAADLTIQCGAVGLAINQSLAFGKPTIIADESGADTEALRHGITGWRYPPGSIDGLVDAVASVLRDEAAVRRITANARETIREEFSLDRMVSSIHECIDFALSSQLLGVVPCE